MSLVVGFVGLSPDWPPTSMRFVPAPGIARVLLTGEKQRERLEGASSRGRGRCLLNITRALWQTRSGSATGGRVRGARDWPEKTHEVEKTRGDQRINSIHRLH